MYPRFFSLPLFLVRERGTEGVRDEGLEWSCDTGPLKS